jgi:tripartite-type tricarboxylate transporter receptor subunit TctC
VVASFDPIAMIGSSPNCIITAPASGITSVADLVQKAKAKPGTINYASTGIGGFNHFGGELFNKVAGVKMVNVPYKGGGPAMTDVMANQIPIMFSSLTQALPNARAGRFRLLAVGAAKRSPAAPDVPTVGEAGYPGYDVAVWWGVTAPAGVAKAAKQRLEREFAAILNDPETQKRLLADAAEPRIMKPEDIRALIVADRNKWTDVAKVANIRIESPVAAR